MWFFGIRGFNTRIVRAVLENLYAENAFLSKITQCIIKAGGTPFLVGGSVRDRLLDKPSKDLDIEVFGLAQKDLQNCLSKHFEVDYVGQSFGVFILKGLPVDIALPRTERQIGNKHTDFEIVADPFLDLRAASSRRDFTINSIYLNLHDGALHDPHNGVKDLENRILKHTSSAFVEDALRVYRAMQFIARFDLTCDETTLQLCKSMNGDHLPQERIFDEFKKLLLKGNRISNGLEFLKDSTWIRYFPELEAMIGCEQDREWHPEGDVWTHTLLALNAFAQRRTGDAFEDLLVGLAVLCHDLGKPATSYCENGRIRSPRHDIEGVPLATQFLERLTQNNKILEAVPPLVKDHMILTAFQKSNVSDAALRRLAMRVGRIDRLLQVCQADREGRQDPWQPLEFPEGDWMRERVEWLEIKDQQPKPMIQGRDLLDQGLSPGPSFKKILDDIFEAQLDGKFQTREEGVEYLKDYLKKN